MCDLRDTTSKQGVALIAVRRKIEGTKGWKKHEDGWITSSGTFQRVFEADDLLLYAAKYFRHPRVVRVDSNALLIEARQPRR